MQRLPYTCAIISEALRLKGSKCDCFIYRSFNVRKLTFKHVYAVKIKTKLCIHIFLEYLQGAFLITEDAKFFMQTMKTRIRLRGCADEFESSMNAHARRYVFSHCGLSYFKSIKANC